MSRRLERMMRPGRPQRTSRMFDSPVANHLPCDTRFRATLEEVIRGRPSFCTLRRTIAHEESDKQRSTSKRCSPTRHRHTRRRRPHHRGVEQDRPPQPGDAAGRDQRRAEGRAHKAELVSATTGEGSTPAQHMCTAWSRGCDRRACHPGARGRLVELALRGERGAPRARISSGEG